MTQRDVTDWLEANPGWHTIQDLMTALDQGQKGVQRSLSLAVSHGYIKARKAKCTKEFQA